MVNECSSTRFISSSSSSSNLYVANCGPYVGISLDQIQLAFSKFGEVKSVCAADQSGARVVVSFSQESSAKAALEAFDGKPCPYLSGRILHIRYSSILQTSSPSSQVNGFLSVSLEASELQIPGIYLLKDFVSSEEEEELLSAVDCRLWKNLAKRRVQHYGYEFMYETRNVNTKHCLGELPSFLSPILKKISSFPNITDTGSIIIDQLTVNEYPPGVGLSPHIDTHSAFEGFIFSLSLAGPCIMEFRKYSKGSWLPPAIQSTVTRGENPEVIRKALFLPPRSMLLLSGEARYAWHHYIPHHKGDAVRGDFIKRASRRVSFTFRKVRNGPCCCEFSQYCDSQSD
ncbi:Alkylated dna repair protein alkb-like protein [Thalictrum thalictroides]|uniref:Alkylated dna repair protein alkb-like protein n=1 Tax=Thalictrum thalictroides TaxID=46969 RepID=A0A7J6XD59_THATH|nr:Alkylated dna repair protein alkb-like protein [Thalictrum thalictroides]